MSEALVVAVSRYTTSLEQVAALVPEHRAWVEQLYESGVMLASGPQDPREGGVLILRAESVEAARTVVEADPLRVGGVAEYTYVLFRPTPAPHRSPHVEAFFTSRA